jgi:hypothetical protein
MVERQAARLRAAKVSVWGFIAKAQQNSGYKFIIYPAIVLLIVSAARAEKPKHQALFVL